jgi:hypothetical protein
MTTLTRCQACASALVQAVRIEPLGDGTCLMVRWCPECEHADQRVVDEAVAFAWRCRDKRFRDSLRAAADAIARADSVELA